MSLEELKLRELSDLLKDTGFSFKHEFCFYIDNDFFLDDLPKFFTGVMNNLVAKYAFKRKEDSLSKDTEYGVVSLECVKTASAKEKPDLYIVHSRFDKGNYEHKHRLEFNFPSKMPASIVRNYLLGAGYQVLVDEDRRRFEEQEQLMRKKYPEVHERINKANE